MSQTARSTSRFGQVLNQLAKLSAAVLVALSLVACGGGSSPQATPADVAPAVTEINGTV